MRVWEVIATILFYLTLPFFYLERVIHKKSGGWKKKFGFCDSIPEGKVIMLHGCSVGEITAVEDLAKRIKKEFPEHKLVITTSTLTGQAIAHKKLDEIADYITFFPFDIPSSIDRFLDRIHPDVVLIAETEIWPCFAFGCKKRNIPLYIINGRISDLSYWMYKATKVFFKEVFNNYSAIFTQSQEDRDKFISIGVKPENAEFMGNLKFGITKSSEKVSISDGGDYKILLAGSTHKPENPIIIDTYKKLKQDVPNLKLLIAPRHLERVKEIESLAQKAGLSLGNRSKDEKFTNERDIIILDTLGELKNMYSVVDAAFIGGSFNNTGGHNPLEATIWEKPVVSGPAIFNFKDIYKILTSSGAAKVVPSKDELYNTLKSLFTDEQAYHKSVIACAKVFDEQKGAEDFVISKLKSL